MKTEHLIRFASITGQRSAFAYRHPLLASMMRPAHAWNGSVSPLYVWSRVISSDGLRVRIEPHWRRKVLPCTLPDVSSLERTAFALLCARSVYQDAAFLDWSGSWLTGRDRSKAAALATIEGRPLAVCDRAYVGHWAVMAAAFPQDPTLAPQTVALIAANLFPEGTFDFLTRAQLAVDMIHNG